MKGQTSFSKENLLSLENGMEPVLYSGHWKDSNMCTGIINFLKIILYMEIILIIGFVCIAFLQVYVLNTNDIHNNEISEQFLSQSIVNASQSNFEEETFSQKTNEDNETEFRTDMNFIEMIKNNLSEQNDSSRKTDIVSPLENDFFSHFAAFSFWMLPYNTPYIRAAMNEDKQLSDEYSQIIDEENEWSNNEVLHEDNEEKKRDALIEKLSALIHDKEDNSDIASESDSDFNFLQFGPFSIRWYTTGEFESNEVNDKSEEDKKTNESNKEVIKVFNSESTIDANNFSDEHNIIDLESRILWNMWFGSHHASDMLSKNSDFGNNYVGEEESDSNLINNISDVEKETSSENFDELNDIYKNIKDEFEEIFTSKNENVDNKLTEQSVEEHDISNNVAKDTFLGFSILYPNIFHERVNSEDEEYFNQADSEENASSFDIVKKVIDDASLENNQNIESYIYPHYLNILSDFENDVIETNNRAPSLSDEITNMYSSSYDYVENYDDIDNI